MDALEKISALCRGIMLTRTLFLALFSAILVGTGIRASAQAHVTENQTTYIYVDANSGNDGNAGTTNSPLRTVQAAATKANTNNRKGVGTKVIIRPGTYRETVTVGAYQSTSAPVTFEASVAGTAIISGSDLLANWTKDNATIWSHSWTPNLGSCAVPAGWPATIAPIARRTEMLFINGIPLTEVMTYGELRAGTFFVNETTNAIYAYPSPYVDMYTAKIEAATRRETLAVSNRTNLVFRGLVFEHAANCINSASAVVSGSSNILFDSVQALWNNWGGIGVYGTNNLTVQNSIANNNGGVGFLGAQDQYVLFNTNQSDYNNWRGAQAALYNWGMGGTKLMEMRNTTVENHFAYRNQAQGLWFDTDNKNITINNVTLAQNVMSSLQIEANEGPITLENSHLCSSGTGMIVINTEKFTVKNNTFYNNGGTAAQEAEIFLAGKPGGRVFRDWLSGESYNLYTSGMELTGNTFENASAGQNVFGTYLSGYDWSHFADTLNSGNNKWFDPTTPSTFKITGNKLVTLGGWRSATGTDYTSSWAKPATSPSGACWVGVPSFTDFAVNLEDESIAMAKGAGSTNVYVNSFGYGAVTLNVAGLPSGVSAHLSKTSLVSGTLTLSLTATKTAKNQTVPITLWASSGARAHSVTVYVSVVHA